MKNCFANIKFAGNFSRVFSVGAIIFSSSVFANPAVPLLPPVALPTNGKVVAGNATIASSQNSTSAAMTVNQTSQRAVVNWDSFNVGKNASVTFNQPNANAVTLNRVTGATASMIEGAVKANGQVVFVNPNGVTFGKGAEINAAGVVATTMDISNKDFMEGKGTYKGNGKGSVINEGKISTNAEGGYIALLAPEVRNDGYLLAKKGSGTVALAAGEQITLDFKGNSLMSVKVDIGTYNALVENKRVVEVNGGLVVIAAGSANQLMASVIKNTGRISASSMVNNGGVIELVANTVNQAGKITANSKTAEGGQINIVGNDITIASNSKTTATGATNGGQVNIGLASTQVSGGTQVNTPTQAGIKANANQAAQNKQLAQTVTIEENALIDTSSTQAGNGGAIAIWSEVKTTVAGILKSMGGSLSGNGGFIETSSKGTVNLAPTAQINTSANNQTGKAGTWLLDPQSLTIDSTAASLISNALSTTNVILDVQATGCGGFGVCSNSGTSSMTFLLGADVYSANPLTTLTLLAQDGTLNFNSNITAGNVYAVAQAINVNGSLNTNGGQNSTIYLAGAVINILGNINSNGSSQGNTSSSTLNSANTTTGTNRRNTVTPLTADQNSYTSNGGFINILATGDINIGANSYISANGQNGGNINIVSTSGHSTVHGIVDSLGKSGNGGLIAIVGKTQTELIGALINSEGIAQGGVINLGQINNLSNGSTLAPPANGPPVLTLFIYSTISNTGNNSITSSSISIDGQTGISAPNGNIVVFGDQIKVNNSSITAKNGSITIGREAYGQGALSGLVAVSSSSLIANRVETSGDLLGTDNVTVRANEWLLDPSTVTIGANSTTGSLAGDISNSGVTNIKASDIVSAVNLGGTVTILATGAITQSTALAFAPGSGVTGTLILDNHGTQAQSITLSGGISSSGAGTLNLQVLAGGIITSSGIISSSSGPINVLMQSFYSSNTESANSSTGHNINIGAAITTKGGYVVLDATGGSVSGTTITMGAITNGSVYTSANIDTTAAASASVGSSTTGGNLSIAGAKDRAANGALQTSASSYWIGGAIDINLKTSGTAPYAYVVAAYAATSTMTSYGNFSLSTTSSSTSMTVSPIYITSALKSYAGSVVLSNSSTGTGAGIMIQADVSASTGITITNSNFGGTGVFSNSSGTMSTATGTVAITSSANIASYYAVNLGALVTTPKLTITATNTNTSGLGASVTGGITIRAGTYASVEDAINITTTVGTAGTTGGINVTTGAITNNSNGGDVSFISNGDITVSAAISFATANTSGHAQTIKYDTTSGNNASQITAGAFTYNATGASSLVNYTQKSKGAPLTVGATSVSGSITIDATNSGTVNISSCTSSSNTSCATGSPTALTAVTVSGALNAGTSVNLRGISSGNVNAVVITGAITAGTSIDFYGATTSGAIAAVWGVNQTGNMTAGTTITGYGWSNENYGGIISTGSYTATGAISLTGYNTNPGGSGNNDGLKISGAISGSSVTLYGSTLSSTSSAITMTADITATSGDVLITGNTVSSSSGSYQITDSGSITSPGSITLLGTGTGTAGINLSGGSGKLIQGNLISITSNATYAPVNITSYMKVVAGYSGLSPVLSIVGNFLTAGTGSGTGINSTGNITIENIGGSISFISNNIINETGPITMVANTSGNVATVTYDTTSGAKGANIVAGSLSIASGSTSDVNYIAKTAGAGINPGVLVIPGYVLLDNTYGGTGGVGGAPTSGYITNSNSPTLTNAIVGINVNSAITAEKGIALRGASQTGYYSVALQAAIATTSGAIVINGAGINYSVYSNGAGTITALSDAVTIAGTSTTGQAVNMSAAITGNAITVTANGTTATTIATLGALNIGYMYSAGTLAAPNFIDLNLGTYIGSVSGGVLPTLSSAYLAGSSIGSGANAIKAATVVYHMDNSTTNTNYLLGWGAAASPYTRMVQINLELVGNQVIATTVAAKTNATVLTTGGATNILTLWNAGTASTAQATSLTTVGYGVANASFSGAVLTNNGSGSLTITANNTAAGSNTGITQSGAIEVNAPGSNITFTSNNSISQSGAISLTANTNTASAITYDATSGNKTTSISGAAVTLAAGSTQGVNYNMLAKGGNLVVSGAVGVNGVITVDNTYGGILPASGYITTANYSTLATTSHGLQMTTGALSGGKGVAINTVSYGNYGLYSNQTISSSTGDISITGVSYGNRGISQTGATTASAGDVTLNGTTTTQYGVYAPTSITGNNITVTGMASGVVAGWVVYLDALTINSGSVSGDIIINATGTSAGNGNGLYQAGAIAGASGSSLTFASNNNISQNGAITLAANTSGSASAVLYDTTSGNKLSTIIAGALSITAGSTSVVNYSALAVGGDTQIQGAVAVNGTVVVNNTYGCSGSNCTPSSAYITTSNYNTLATTTHALQLLWGALSGSQGININVISYGNYGLYSNKNISSSLGNIAITGISYGNRGISHTGTTTASAGDVTLSGTTTTQYGVYVPALITGNNITVTGIASAAVAGWVVYLDALTINSGSAGGNITVTATGTSAGNDSGIYQASAISGANGSDITFTSNNIINQSGVITMAANTTATSSVTYDTTSGNRLSTISSAALTTTSGSTFDINYTVKSSGSAISLDAVSVPGYINIDNTYGSASGAKASGYFTGANITTSNVTGSSGVLVGGILTAGGAFTIKGDSASGWGIQNSSAYTLTAGSGDLTLLGVGAHGIYQMGSLVATSGDIIASALAMSSSWSYYAASGVQKNYIASGDINLIAYSTTYSNAFYITNILMKTASGDITLSAKGGATGNGALHQATYLAGDVINAGGNFTIQGATNTGGIATAAPGTASLNTLAHYGVHFASTASLAYGGITYTGYKATGNISIAGTSSGSYGVYIVAPIESTAGSITITGTSTTGYGVATTSTGAITGNAGVAIYGVGAAGSVTTAALVRNNGSTGGIILNAATDASIGAVTNSGAAGIRITGGNTIAAGTTTGGTITALGTVTNTGGIVALSMAAPRVANSYDVEGAVGITTSNASDANIRYSVQGGNFTAPTSYSSGNYIDYRAAPTAYTITVSLGGNYSASYGTAYTDSSALTWLRNNATVTLSATPFGVSAAGVKAGLVWNSTIGSAGLNANAVQAATTIISANILSGSGQGVTLSGTGRTYTISPAALTITDLASTSTYNASTTYASLVATAGYGVSGLVTSIGGIAVTDAVTSVTQTIKSGAVVGSGSVITGVAQNGSFNTVPSAAVGVGLSNYSITYVGVASTVNKATLTITAAADTKVYGNTSTAAGVVYSAGAASASGGVGYSISSGALLGSDTLTGVTLTSTGGVATTAVGTGISIVPSLATGSGIGNYTITYANGAMAVTARPLTLTASTQNANYGSSYALGTSSFTTSGLANTDAVSSVTLKYNGSSTVAGTTNAGTYTSGIIPSAASGSGLSNYTISYVAGNLVVATKALTITASTQNSTYGSAYSLGSSSFTTGGLVNTDAVSSVTLLYAGNATVAPTVNASTYSGGIIASAASGTGLSNYTISYVSGNLVVGKATITLTPNGSIATYDASTLANSTYSQNAANYSISGYKNTDSATNVAITLSGSMAFNGSTSTIVKNAATYALTVGTFAGTTTNSNYQIAFANPASKTYLINPATLTVAAAKDYDGSQSFAANKITVSTGVGSQTIALTGSATANSANVTGVSSLSTTGLSLVDGSNGGLAANYLLPASTSSVVIRPLTVTASIIGSPTKVYDATTTAILVAGDYSLSGFIMGQGASVSQTLGAYNYANATANTLYTPATSISAALIPSHFTPNLGTDLSNYTLPTTATGSATITVAPLTVKANSYAAFAGQSPTFAGTVTGAQGSDGISVGITQSPSGVSGIYTLTPAAAFSNPAVVGNYATPTVITGTYTEAQQYQLVVTASGASNSYGVTSASSSANSVVNLVAQYCTVSSNCNSGTIVTLTMAAPSATASQITTSSITTPTWVATDASANTYSIKVASDVALGFSGGNFLNAGSYTMTPSGATNATISGATNPVIYIPGNVAISPLALTVTNNSAPTKVYDATTALTNGVSLAPANKLTGDNLSVSGSGTYTNKNVGTTAYTITSVSVAGTDAANYRYTAGNISGNNGTITAAPITISGLAASNKVYDAGLIAVITGTPTAQGVLGADTVTVSGSATAGSFATANVATGIAVTPVLTNLGLSNANYQIIDVTTPLSANITAAPITATINREYNGSTLVANGDIAITGVAGQTLILSAGTATLTNPNVGSAALSSLNGASLANGTGLASNYTVTNPVGVVTITPAALSISASDAIKVYDTNTSVASATTAPVAIVASGTLYTNSVTGYIDSLSGGSFSYATSAAGSGNKTLNVSGVSILNDATSAASNYSITYVANTTSTISKAPITISGLSASNKVYDTGLSAAVTGTPTAYGVLGSDVVTVSGAVNSGSFASANVGTGLVVTPVISGLTLSNANYSITGITSPLTANITAAPVTISGLSASNKVYDTGLSAAVTGTPTAYGVLGSDVVTVSGALNSGSFASANVGIGLVVTPVISGLTLSNANYSITGITSPLTANITAAPVTVTASAQTTVYGTPLALGSVDFTTSGLLGGDSISSVTLTQLSNTTVPGTQNAGTYSGATNGILPSAANGSNLTNYQITYVPGVLTISRKAIDVVANNSSMTYGDSTLPTLSYQTVSGLVNSDQLSGALATTASAYNGVAGSASNIGSYFINQGTVTAGPNYEITYTRATLSVNQANLTVQAQNQASTYGSLLVLPQSGSNAYFVSGLKNGDSVSSATVLYSGNQTIQATTNAGDYLGAIDISVANGVRLGNYNITYISGDLSVAKALLTVTAVDSAKFVGTNDPSGYGGVMYSGFKNSDTALSGALGSAVVSVSRSNSSVNNAGIYSDVLVPNVSTDLQNYRVGYGNGKFTIVGANELLVQVGSNTTVYGTPASYSGGSMTVSYCTDCALGNSSPNIIALTGADITTSGSSVAIVAGNTTGAFTISPVNPSMNTAGTQIAIGNYGLRASNTSISTSPPGGTPNFIAITVVGGLNVTPLQLTYADLGITGVSQVYNGTVNMSNLGITATSGILSGDVVNVNASGTFASKNVGINIPYTVGIGLSGGDASNYQIDNSTPLTGANGVITQLNSVTYTGPNSGSSWSNPANWTTTSTIGTNQVQVGAIPDLSNVANVVLPTGYSVIYDDAVQGPVTSAVANSGNLTFNLSSANTISMPISGTGSVTIANTGAVTLTGNSSYTGGTILNPGSSVIAGSNNALGNGLVNSSGTLTNPSSFSTTSGVVLPTLNIVGGTTAVLSDITTTGAQSYSGNLIIGPSLAGTTTFQSSNANILIDATINGAVNKTESLVINAGTGVVTLGDSIGATARLNNLTVTGSKIYILADIITGIAQTYNGSIYIGDASYLNKTPTVGFLFTDNYKGYFQYVAGAGVSSSTISYLDLNPIYVRTMISEDPSISYNGTVNDTVANTHTLLVAAIAPAVIPYSSGYATVNAGASISFNAAVGASAPLYSLNVQTVISNTQANAATNFVGTVGIVDSVATYSNQTYRANMMTAQASAQPATVTFSVWDPAAAINFNVPVQSVDNSGCSTNCGQINLQNPNSLDALTINGGSNFVNNANLTGQNNWGNQLTVSNALGYVAPPPVLPPVILPIVVPDVPALPEPVRVSQSEPTPFNDNLSGGALREALDYHADQAQMFVDMKVLMAGVTVSTPEEIAAAPRKPGLTTKALKNGDSSVICSIDEKGDMYCGED